MHDMVEMVEPPTMHCKRRPPVAFGQAASYIHTGGDLSGCAGSVSYSVRAHVMASLHRYGEST